MSRKRTAVVTAAVMGMAPSAVAAPGDWTQLSTFPAATSLPRMSIIDQPTIARRRPSATRPPASKVSPSRTAWGWAGIFSCTMARARITKPGVQKPHCSAWCLLKHCCITCKSDSLWATPSMVVTCCPWVCKAKRLHDLMAAPLTKTVQAPHWAVSQPWCVPVRWHCSRSTSINKSAGDVSSVTC